MTDWTPATTYPLYRLDKRLTASDAFAVVLQSRWERVVETDSFGPMGSRLVRIDSEWRDVEEA